jgi:hypothetical protein
MADFKWTGDDADAVILPHQPRTAVYIGGAGHVVVRQEREFDEECDPRLLFTPQGALATAWAMIREAHNIGLPEPCRDLLTLNDTGTAEPIRTGAHEAEASSDTAPPPGPLLRVMEASA